VSSDSRLALLMDLQGGYNQSVVRGIPLILCARNPPLNRLSPDSVVYYCDWR